MMKPKEHRKFHLPRWFSVLLLSGISWPTLGCDSSSGRLDEAVQNPPAGEQPGFPLAEHVDQSLINLGAFPFPDLFFAGDELFEAEYNSLDGVGVLRLPDGTGLPGRFSRVPPGGGRVTGPNGQSCQACHNTPFGTAAGEASSNVLQDPDRDGFPPFNTRNALSLFGSAALQRLAEEITEDLQRIRDEAGALATPTGPVVARDLISKGISFGEIITNRVLPSGEVLFNTSNVRGVGPDLVVRPYGWKGNITTLRDFTRGASQNELGMEADELVAKDPFGRSDPDGDGVTGEFSVGDITALTIYIGAQEIPQPRSLLVRAGLLPPPTGEESRLATEGEALFDQVGCTTCHIPELRLGDPVFEEPTRRGRNQYLDHDMDVETSGLDPDNPFRFSLVLEGDRPRLIPHPQGGARVSLYGDLRYHNMGRILSDPVATDVNGANGEPVIFDGAPLTVNPGVFLTAELWGVGNSGPWLHDGRAGSLMEAVLLHGEEDPPAPFDPERSEAQESRDAFVALDADQQLAVVEFLRSLLHFSHGE